MARGGLSSDPAKRARQLAALAGGRAVAETRRKAGLPPRRRQSSRESSATEAGAATAGASGESRVVQGNYPEGGSGNGPSRRRGRKASAADEHAEDEHAEREPEIPGWVRRYGRILGYEL